MNKEGVSPLALLGAIATWLGLALAVVTHINTQVQRLEIQLHAYQIEMHGRLTRLETKVDALMHRQGVRPRDVAERPVLLWTD
jgi:hypothetical protein